MKKLLPFLLSLSLCSAAEKFDWGQILTTPPGSEQVGGNQILHFKSRNKPYWDNEAANQFADQYLSDAAQLTSDAEVLRYGSDRVKIKGLYIELGVCTGKTINFLAALNPHQRLYGFDSFEGLPEDWVRADRIFPAGTFAFRNPELLPPVLHNVELIKGWFKDTLPPFTEKHEQQIAFLHIDSDIYSAAATAFQVLGCKIRPGTIIVFDEFYNYPGSENHEFKALQEFLAQSGFEAKYLAYNIYHEQVAVEIVEKK
jgi:hypothetical protein